MTKRLGRSNKDAERLEVLAMEDGLSSVSGDGVADARNRLKLLIESYGV